MNSLNAKGLKPEQYPFEIQVIQGNFSSKYM